MVNVERLYSTLIRHFAEYAKERGFEVVSLGCPTCIPNTGIMGRNGAYPAVVKYKLRHISVRSVVEELVLTAPESLKREDWLIVMPAVRKQYDKWRVYLVRSEEGRFVVHRAELESGELKLVGTSLTVALM